MSCINVSKNYIFCVLVVKKYIEQLNFGHCCFSTSITKFFPPGLGSSGIFSI